MCVCDAKGCVGRYCVCGLAWQVHTIGTKGKLDNEQYIYEKKYEMNIMLKNNNICKHN